MVPLLGVFRGKTGHRERGRGSCPIPPSGSTEGPRAGGLLAGTPSLKMSSVLRGGAHAVDKHKEAEA